MQDEADEQRVRARATIVGLSVRINFHVISLENGPWHPKFSSPAARLKRELSSLRSPDPPLRASTPVTSQVVVDTPGRGHRSVHAMHAGSVTAYSTGEVRCSMVYSTVVVVISCQLPRSPSPTVCD